MNTKRLEQCLEQKILPDLERGRPDYDKPHTLSVVEKVRDIIKNEPQLDLDEIVLIAAAYAHDWGYADLFVNGDATYDAIKDVKKLHMDIGSQKLSKLLQHSCFDSMTAHQKARAVHLVQVHDDLKKLHSLDELVLMEADTLGALDISTVAPTFDYHSNKRWMDGVLQERLCLFVTDYSKRLAKELVQQRRDFFEQFKESYPTT